MQVLFLIRNKNNENASLLCTENKIDAFLHGIKL